MTQVDFYILGTNSQDSWLRLACRITEKAIKRNLDVYMHSESEADANKLDRLLWTFSQGSFIPHRIIGNNTEPPYEEPVLIGCHSPATEPATGTEASQKWDVMINLTGEVPEFFSRYDRVAEVVDADPTRRERGRERFRFYRDRGYELTTHNI
ncbi:MAG: DNA polymerase III subunit chi [Candidatus Rariloculaceae bacterium]